MSAYGNNHRAFLQALLSRQVFTYREAQPILAAIQSITTPERATLSEDVSQEDLDDYVDALNTSISRFDLEIRSTTHQISKDRIYALVNTTSDALTQMATVHSADEIAFIKRVIDIMFDHNNTPRAEIIAVTSTQALNVAKSPNELRRGSGVSQQPTNMGLSKSQAEKVLGDLVGEELRGWLVETYNDWQGEEDDDEEETYHKIKFCQACRDLVTIGQRCPNLRCPARLHDHCARYMFRAQGGAEQCPRCKEPWSTPHPVGEKAARLGRIPINGQGISESSTTSAVHLADNDDRSGAGSDD